jgi:hypothetical protein
MEWIRMLLLHASTAILGPISQAAR